LSNDTINTYLLYIINLDLVSSEQVLQDTGLTLAQVSSKKNIGFEAFSKAVENMGRYSPDPIWPSLLGSKLGATSHGAIGFAALSAPTIGKAISTFVEWEQIRVDTYDYEFAGGIMDARPEHGAVTSQEGAQVIIFSDTTSHRYYHFCFFQAFSKMIEILISEISGSCNNKTMCINFDCENVELQGLLSKRYTSLLSFEQGVNKVTIPQHIWDTVSPNYDNESYSLNLSKCLELSDTLSRQNRADFVVTNLVKSHLEKNISRQFWPEPLPTVGNISSAINTSERTLIRRLGKLGTSYKDIIDNMRREYAQRLLKDAKYSVNEISDILGYQASANFCRAFKTWMGVTPTQFRRKL